MNRLPLLLLGVLAAASSPLAAVPLRILPWNKEVAERKLSIAYNDKELETGYLHPSARSEPVAIPAGATGLRVVTQDRTDEQGRPLSVALRLPSGVRRPLLILLPDPKQKPGLRPFIIEDDPADFAWGSFRLFNVTPKALAFRWGKSGKELKPGWTATDIEPGGEPRNLEVYLYDKGDLANPLYRAVWEYRKDMRQLVFVVPSQDASLGPYQFKFVPETRLEEEDAE